MDGWKTVVALREDQALEDLCRWQDFLSIKLMVWLQTNKCMGMLGINASKKNLDINEYIDKQVHFSNDVYAVTPPES